MTPAADQHRAAQAFQGAWRWFAETLPTGRQMEHDGIAVLATGLPDAMLNPAFVLAAPANPHDAIRRAAVARADLAAPTTGIDLPAGHHPVVEAALGDLGYAERVRRPGMVVEPSALVRRTPPAGLTLRAVADRSDWLGYVEAQVEVFGFAPDLAEQFPPYDALDAPGVRLVIGTIGGRVVCTAAVFLVGRTAGLYAVATRAEVRGRGFGSAVTECAVDMAGRLGADLVALQSSPAGYGVYRRLGFRDVGDWVVHVDPSVE